VQVSLVVFWSSCHRGFDGIVRCRSCRLYMGRLTFEFCLQAALAFRELVFFQVGVARGVSMYHSTLRRGIPGFVGNGFVTLAQAVICSVYVRRVGRAGCRCPDPPCWWGCRPQLPAASVWERSHSPTHGVWGAGSSEGIENESRRFQSECLPVFHPIVRDVSSHSAPERGKIVGDPLVSGWVCESDCWCNLSCRPNPSEMSRCQAWLKTPETDPENLRQVGFM
jgi:hypothetical protein